MAKSMHRGGLGKGLSDLFGEEINQENNRGETVGVSTLPMAMVEPNKEQPRKVFDPMAMEELTESIRTHGIVTPITVRKRENGYYQIIAGERRWRAARAAGITEIPAMVLEADDSTVIELALIENLQRQDLNPIEEAEGYGALMNDFSMTQDQVAERVGKSRSAVANALRLLTLETPIRNMVAEGRLSSGHARAVLAIHEEKERLAAAEKMTQLSVRQAENLAKRINRASKKGAEDSDTGLDVDYLAELEKKLENRLGRKVKIVSGKKSGMLSLEYYGNEDLERLTEALSSIEI